MDKRCKPNWQRKDETGNVYGRLIVISLSGKDNRGQCVWLCRCSCGNEKIVKGEKLRQGQTKSCGCLRREITSALTKLSPEEIDRRKSQPRKCSKCGNLFPPQEFKNLRHHRCKKCVAEYSKKRLFGKHRFVALRDKYGLGEDDYRLILEKQNGVCVICGGVNPNNRHLCVDHDHSKGKKEIGFIRGLLCDGCNKGIGNFKDSPLFLRNAANYLENT